MDSLKLTIFRHTLKATWVYVRLLDDMENRGAFCALYDLIDELDLEEEYQDWKRAVLAILRISPDNLNNLCGVSWEQLNDAIRKVDEATQEIFSDVRNANDAIVQAQRKHDEQ